MEILHVTLASDGSVGALRAADWIKAHFAPDEITLTILAVSHNPTDLGSANFAQTVTNSDVLEEAAMEAARKAGETTEATLHDFHPVLAVIGGRSIVPAIMDYIKEHPTDAIVIGRRGHSLVHNLLIGSVSSGLSAHSTVPVWMIP